MFIRKPKDLTANKYWFFKHNKLEKEAKPAKYGCKRKYITKKILWALNTQSSQKTQTGGIWRKCSGQNISVNPT